MLNKWYGDNRDLLKWGTLIHLAEKNGLQCILQIAYLRQNKWPSMCVDGEEVPIPRKVVDHFRRLNNVESVGCDHLQIHVLETVFSDRNEYSGVVKYFVNRFSKTKRLIFLDPDTGLE